MCNININYVFHDFTFYTKPCKTKLYLLITITRQPYYALLSFALILPLSLFFTLSASGYALDRLFGVCFALT